MTERSTADRLRAEQQGRDGEAQAAHFLKRQGYEILAERVRNAAGEIDLIARKDALVTFVEVKWRKRAADLDTAIDERRLARVAAAAEIAAYDYAKQGEDIRVDVILLAPGASPRHIINAWMP